MSLDETEREVRTSRGNPDWRREELILALEVYVQHAGNPPRPPRGYRSRPDRLRMRAVGKYDRLPPLVAPAPHRISLHQDDGECDANASEDYHRVKMHKRLNASPGRVSARRDRLRLDVLAKLEK